MNIFFERLEDGRSIDFNSEIGFGRLDDIEPILDEPDHALLSFNVIDKIWLQYNGLQTNGHIYRNTRLEGMQNNPYEDAPLYRIEIRTWINPNVYSSLEEYFIKHHTTWRYFNIRRLHVKNGNANLYTNLFLDPIRVQVDYQPVSKNHQEKLNREFSLDLAERIDSQTLATELQNRTPGPDYLAVYDVGQGNSNSLISGSVTACPDIYFDIGAGVTGNKHTTPSPLTFCFSNNPLIIMSHWDKDHWAGACPKANGVTSALSLSWIVTDQNLDPVHKIFAQEIIAHGGRVRVLDIDAKHIGHAKLKNGTSIKFMKGTGRGKNASGLVLAIENNDEKYPASWLLTGDCDYEYFIDTLQPSPPIAIVAPHHGAAMKKRSKPPAPSTTSDYRRLIYSYGRNNSFKSVRHPTKNSVEAHKDAGWKVGIWEKNPGHCVKTDDVCATADHDPSSTVRGGVIVGWEAISCASVPTCLTCNCTTLLVTT